MQYMRDVACAFLVLLPCANAQYAPVSALGGDEAGAPCLGLPETRQRCGERSLTYSSELQPRAEAMRVATRAYHREVADVLADSGEPRRRALAALLRARSEAADPALDPTTGDATESAPTHARGAQLQSAAVGKAVDDPITNLLLLQGDDDVRNAAAARWAASEPDNLAPLLLADMPSDAVLDAAWQRQRHDMHFHDTVRWLMSVLAESIAPPESLLRTEYGALDPREFHALTAIGLWNSVANPPLQPLHEACLAYAQGASTVRRAACRQVAKVLAESSDTMLGQRFGIALLEDTAGTPQERAESRVLRQRIEWRIQRWQEVTRRLPGSGITDFVRLMQDPSILNEEQLMLRQLRDSGIALDPPPGWEPVRAE